MIAAEESAISLLRFTFDLPLLLVLLSLAIALLLSSYVKIATVLGILRVGLGFTGIPSAFVTGGLAVALTYFVMYPTFEAAGRAVDRELDGKVAGLTAAEQSRALRAAGEEWKQFLLAHTDPEVRQRFSTLAQDAISAEALKQGGETAKADEGIRVLVPSFLVTELEEAFRTGLSLFLPFLVIDLLVGSVLAAIGISRVNPLVVAFPFKLLLFVATDGWLLITSNLVATYSTGG